MSSDTEPPMKKTKIIEDINIILTETIDKCIERLDSEKNLQAVVSDELNQPLQLVKVFVGHIKNVKDISRTIQILNERIPLNELSHLKRVRRQDIILCPTSVLHDMTSIQDYIDYQVSELKDVFDYFKEITVPMLPPKLIKEYNEARKIWSCHFHPNHYVEKLVSDNFFNAFELRTHKTNMKLVFEIFKWYTMKGEVHFDVDDIFKNINVCVVINPSLNKIVSIAFDNRQEHPVQHSAMLAIDNVAKTQNGGAWSVKDSNDSPLPIIDNELIQHLKTKYSQMMYIEKPQTKNDLQDESGAYLCTGYYIYLLKEPCLMCSMALVHARAKRIFFCFDNHVSGALSSKTKLQTVSSLNHHFEVFTGFI